MNGRDIIERLSRHFPRLFGLLHQLYGKEYDFFYHLADILDTATKAWINRSPELKALDAIRENDPKWYQSNRMLGAVCYVDLFAGDLKSMKEKIPYLKELGLSYLHLMPIFKSPEGDNDGGYAVSSYREVNPELGTMDDLKELAEEMRNHGISLVLDFVFNHTADDHEWALNMQMPVKKSIRIITGCFPIEKFLMNMKKQLHRFSRMITPVALLTEAE